MDTLKIIQDQRVTEEYGEAIEMIMQRLPRTEEQIKQIEAYVTENAQALVNEYTQMIDHAIKNDVAIGYYDIWAIAKADEALFG